MPRAFTDEERVVIDAQLRAAAVRAAAAGGLRKCSVAKLAADAGISKGSFYAFYESKEALALALLGAAEQQLREQLMALLQEPEPVGAVLGVLFRSVQTHPLLGTLVDPDEYAWLIRSVPPGAFEAAAADDDRWFGELYDQMVTAGQAVASGRQAFIGLPRMALALAHRPELVSEESLELLLESLELALRARPGAR